MIRLTPIRSALAALVLAGSGVAATAQTGAQGQAQGGKPAATQAKPAQAVPVQGKPTAQKPAQGQAAQAKPAAAPAARPGGAQAVLLATYGDWGAYATQGKDKVCYALAQPKDRQPASLKRDPGYLFVSFRPSANVRNEIAVMMGFPTKEGGAAQAVVGRTAYALITKDQNAWVKNPAEEAQVIAALQKGPGLVVKATSLKGNQSTDRYSLNGFGQALERARKECS